MTATGVVGRATGGLGQIEAYFANLSTIDLIQWAGAAAGHLVALLTQPQWVAAEVMLILVWMPLLIVLRGILQKRQGR
jgi:hypothetical protein